MDIRLSFWKLVALRENRSRGGRMLVQLSFIEQDGAFDRYKAECVGISEDDFTFIINRADKRDYYWEYERFERAFIPLAQLDFIRYFPQEDHALPVKRTPIIMSHFPREWTRKTVVPKSGETIDEALQARAPYSLAKLNQKETLRELSCGQIDRVKAAIWRIGCAAYEEELPWVTKFLSQATTHSDPAVQAQAFASIGEISRVHGFVDPAWREVLQIGSQSQNIELNHAADKALREIDRFATPRSS
jgi:hypothetical protein